MSWLESELPSLTIFQRIINIVIANRLEEMYCLCLQRRPTELTQIFGWLFDAVTEGFLNEIVSTYAKKKSYGEHALACSFPVVLDKIIVNNDETISLTQHFHIEWSSGQIDDLEIEHVYMFDGSKISNETGPGGRPLRRKS